MRPMFDPSADSPLTSDERDEQIDHEIDAWIAERDTPEPTE